MKALDFSKMPKGLVSNLTTEDQTDVGLAFRQALIEWAYNDAKVRQAAGLMPAQPPGFDPTKAPPADQKGIKGEPLPGLLLSRKPPAEGAK